MADEKEKPKSNILRKNTTIPEEKQEDYKKFLSERKSGGDGGKLSADAEAILKTIKLNSIHTAAMEKAWMEKDKSDRSVKLPPVMVAKYSEEALKQMGIVKPKVGEKEEETKKDKDSSFLTKLFTAAIPLLAVGAGLIGSIKGMMQGGPMQGIMNLLSKLFLVIGDNLAKKLPGMGFISKIFTGKGGFIRNMLAKLFGKAGVVTKIFGKGGAKLGLGLFKGIGKTFLKRLPIIGSLISVGSAIKRLKDGDILGGLVDIGAAIAYMFPGVGTAIGIALDLFNAGTDIAAAKQGVTKGSLVKDALVNAFTFITDKISKFMESGIQFIVDQLYALDFIPNGLIDRALDALGLPSYKKGEELALDEDITNKRAIIERQKKKPKNRQGNISKLESELYDLEAQKEDLALKRGRISRDEYLLENVGEMVATKDVRVRESQTKRLQSQGFTNEEITKLFMEMRDSMKEQTEAIKEQKEVSPNITANSQSSVTNNSYGHTGNSTKTQRNTSRRAKNSPFQLQSA
jgi:hypothetical protein